MMMTMRTLLAALGLALACAISSSSAMPVLHLTSEVQELMEKGTNSFHYGDPTTGCMIDEVAIRVQGIKGGICTAHCTAVGACPGDKPPGSDAVPRCALENRGTGEKFCALLCTAGMNCGAGATCKVLQGNLGICTYDDVYATSNLRNIGSD